MGRFPPILGRGSTPHAWGTPCNAWFCAAGYGSTSDFTLRFRLHASYFVSPHAWGTPCNAWFCAAGCGATSDSPSRFRLHASYFIYPTRVGSEIKYSHNGTLSILSTPQAWGLKQKIGGAGLLPSTIHPTRVGLRAAKPPRAEESAPTTWGARIMDWVALPHTRGVPHAMYGSAQQAAALLRTLLHASDFMLPTSYPHTRGV